MRSTLNSSGRKIGQRNGREILHTNHARHPETSHNTTDRHSTEAHAKDKTDFRRDAFVPKQHTRALPNTANKKQKYAFRPNPNFSLAVVYPPEVLVD